LNTAPVPVIITGAHFISSPLPTARLGTDVSIAITAATSVRLDGIVPADIQAGVYGLTVQNFDGRSGSLSPAYVALNPLNPDTTLERGYVSTFGPSSPDTDGDDDHVQVIFFDLPASSSDNLYFRIFDADTGNSLDEIYAPADTTIRYALYGGAGAYTGARVSHPAPSQINAGTLLAETTIGENSAYDNGWQLVFGPFSATQGEDMGSRRVFKLVVQGTSGDDGNLYNAVLSTNPGANVPPAGSRTFAYAWTLPLASDPAQRPALYPYVPTGSSEFRQYNYDADFTGGSDTITLRTPIRTVSLPPEGVSGDGTTANASLSIVTGEHSATWTMLLAWSSPAIWNDVTLWATADGVDLPIFARPTMASPP